MARRKKKSQKQLLLAAICLTGCLLLLLGGVLLSLLLRENAPVTIETTPGIPVASNEYEEEKYYREEGLLRYEGAHMVGIDVSAHQGVVDWEAVSQSGIEFVILRAGYRGSSQGLLYEDETFQKNFKAARKAGLKIGVYFFSQARDIREADEEGEFLAEILDGEKLDLPVFYDWELVDSSSRIPDLYEIPMTECTLAFCQRMEREGYEAGVYFNQSFGYYHLDMSQLQDYTLWLAEYNEIPGFDYHFHLVQYTDKGKVEGIETAVDLNLWILE